MSKTIQVRNVPERVHRKLKSRAAMEGPSLVEAIPLSDRSGLTAGYKLEVFFILRVIEEQATKRRNQYHATTAVLFHVPSILRVIRRGHKIYRARFRGVAENFSMARATLVPYL